jgi:hypothetical protein
MAWQSATFGTGQFDNSYFDITDSRWIDMKNNHEYLLDNEGELMDITRVNTIKDTQGVVTSKTETSDEGLRVKFQPLGEEKRQLTGRGVSVTGNARVYCKRSYDLTNNGVLRVSVGDYFTRKNDGTNNKWRVEQIDKYFAFNAEVYRKAIVKRLEA